MKLPKSYKPAYSTIKKYWEEYGGASAFFKSPYLHVAVVLAVAFVGFVDWGFKWWDKAIAIVPSVMGFTLAAFTIFLSMATSEVGLLLSGASGQRSYLKEFSYTFFHFIIVQLVCLLFCLVASLVNDFSLLSLVMSLGVDVPKILLWSNLILRQLFNFVGLTVFFYSLMIIMAALIAILRVALMSDRFNVDRNDQNQQT